MLLRAPHGVWIKSTIKRRATNTRSTATTAFTYPPEPGSGSSPTRARAASLSVGVAATSPALPPAPRLSDVPPPVSAAEAAAVRHLSAPTHHLSQRSGVTQQNHAKYMHPPAASPPLYRQRRQCGRHHRLNHRGFLRYRRRQQRVAGSGSPLGGFPGRHQSQKAAPPPSGTR